MSQTFLSWEIVKSVVNYWNGLLEAEVITPADFMAGSSKRRISTSSMTAPSAMECVDADGETTTSSENALRSLFGVPDTSNSSIGSTGCMFSYISFCPNGRADKKYGLIEEYEDFRVVLKIYDGQTCAKNPQKYWIGKEKELDITLSRRDPLMKKVNLLFLEAYELLTKRGADFKKSANSHPFY
ncbi:uncharacterized protein TNCV_2403091 [Trichonephila clavipes]|uniref:Uncharacterized protein n=1 Tax=Trichonephila clavipes TaxID=2585209 RepID=A0A8X6UWB5_TRICX|nr:uncharacterized protein TNCV_2403091 [Trichonephila clavipes]